MPATPAGLPRVRGWGRDGLGTGARGRGREGADGVDVDCAHLLRPAVAQGRLRLTEDGLLELKRPWQEGTSHLVFEPLDLLARLAALTPRPRVNLIIYHGVLAPNARVRAAVVTFGTPAAATPALAAGGCSGGVYVTYGLHVVFDNIRLPYTAVGFRYDINHGRWHGPNAGN